MNGIEKITGRIEADAREQASAITADAEAKCAEIRADYDKLAQDQYWARVRDGVKTCEDRVQRMGRLAEMEARKSILALKQEMVDAAFAAALERICTMPQADYVAYLAKLAAQAATTGTEALVFNAKDQAACGQAVADAANALLAQQGKQARLTVSSATRDLRAGFVLQQGDIEVNCAVLHENLIESELFGYEKHPFTGVDYVEYYGDLFRAEGCEPVFLFGNDVRAVLPYTKNVLCCDIHTRERSRRRLLAAGAEKVLLLSDLMTAPVNGSGYNEQFGLLGSNKATEESVKLFPRDCRSFVDALAQSLRSATGRQIEVMVYGDGAFKDPVGKIWELADPVVSPAYTSGLEGQPNELKLKYLADNDFASLSGDALTSAIKDSISHKNADLKGQMSSQGTTPRRLTDLIGSLCDLTSGSGDKGTPIIYIQGYFDNYTNE